MPIPTFERSWEKTPQIIDSRLSREAALYICSYGKKHGWSTGEIAEVIEAVTALKRNDGNLH